VVDVPACRIAWHGMDDEGELDLCVVVAAVGIVDRGRLGDESSILALRHDGRALSWVGPPCPSPRLAHLQMKVVRWHSSA
jgi:hypothetical protein